MKLLDPKAKVLFFIQNVLVFPIITFSFSAFLTYFFNTFNNNINLSVVALYALVFLVFVIVLSYIIAELSYRNYKYELKPEGFRKEHGIIWKKYVTIPYERIQNVDIYRGVFARLLGLSDLQIQTAGMSTPRGSYGAGSEGRLPGLSQQDAEKLRDELIKRAKGPSSSQGL